MGICESRNVYENKGKNVNQSQIGNIISIKNVNQSQLENVKLMIKILNLK